VGDAYSPPVELVDRAVWPDQKSWPPRKLFALVGLLLGGVAGTLMVAAEAMELRRRLRALEKRYALAKANDFRA
jgi:uncharacterized protein involved in exopolysaccharide biosynthesis